ncbi:hypothetical protein [Rubritalea tangerina]
MVLSTERFEPNNKTNSLWHSNYTMQCGPASSAKKKAPTTHPSHSIA